MLKAGNDPNTNTDPSPEAPPPWANGLAIGRVVHVWIQLPSVEVPWDIVERPAIVTEVKDRDRGIISAHVFMSPEDPPGEILIHEGGRPSRPLGAELRHAVRHVQLAPSWHWPERV